MTDPDPRPPFAGAVPLLGIVASGLAALLGIALGLAPTGGPAPAAQSELPEFSLIAAATGRSFTRRDLLGSIWVVDFIFTRCSGACPMMSERMGLLRRHLDRAGFSDVRLLTITVDPDFDTPEVLTDYARKHGADERWVFLTGEREAIGRLGKTGFKVSTVEDINAHSIRFMLVDRAARVRGTYDAVERPGLEKEADAEYRRLAADIHAVRGEPDLSLILPAVNAALNTLAAVLLGAGLVFIRSGRVGAHRNCMTAAFLVSCAFLADYVYYHWNFPARPFTGAGPLRTVYRSILLSHIALAFVIVPLAATTLVLAWRRRWTAHRRIARWTWPIWMYVSVTGLAIYWMLYRMPIAPADG